MSNYHNTTHQSGAILQDFAAKAQTQDDLVMWLFEAFNNDGITPSKVWQDLITLHKIDRSTPLTSIRRSITNLTKSGKLEQTELQRKGFYGRPETIWRIAKKPTTSTNIQQSLFN